MFKLCSLFVADNGLNPVWNEQCDFDIINPEVALLRFVVQDMDMFNDPHFMGQAVFPVRCLRSGKVTPSRATQG